MKLPTRYAATTMWAAINGIALLKITPMGSTSVTLPEESSVTGRVHPGVGRHDRDAAEDAGDSDGHAGPEEPTASAGASRRCMEMNTASVKKNRPSNANGRRTLRPTDP